MEHSEATGWDKPAGATREKRQGAIIESRDIQEVRVNTDVTVLSAIAVLVAVVTGARRYRPPDAWRFALLIIVWALGWRLYALGVGWYWVGSYMMLAAATACIWFAGRSFVRHGPCGPPAKSARWRKVALGALVLLAPGIVIHFRMVQAKLLCSAALNGDASGVKAILNTWADANAPGNEVINSDDCECEDDPSPAPALHFAAYRGHLDVMSLLVGHGARVNARGADRMAAIHWATGARAIEFLLDHGARVDQRDGYGRTALLACTNGPDAVKLLLAHHADPNVSDNEGKTALIEATVNGSAASVKALLASRADSRARDHSGKTAMDYAAVHGYPEIAALLSRRGSSANAR